MTAKHQTLFVYDGSIMVYDDGTMLELHMQITRDEWETIVEQTVQYKVFITCLKNIAYPILEEVWEEDDEWYLKQLDIAVSRIRNIDALSVAKHDIKKIEEAYSTKIRNNANEVQGMIKKVREQKRQIYNEKYKFDDIETSSL